MSKKIKLHHATKEDLDVAFQLICKLEREKPKKEKFKKIYLENVKDSHIHLLIVKKEEKVIGMGILNLQNLFHGCEELGEVQEIFVDKEDLEQEEKETVNKMIMDKFGEIVNER